MSQQAIVTLRFTLVALFLTFLITASLLANIISSPRSSQILLPPHRHDGGTLDALAEMAIKSFSESWAAHSPYHPAAPFEGSTREGCVVSQVNIVSHHFFHAISSGTSPVDAYHTFQLQRHGARYPTTGATRKITAALAKLQAASSYNDTKLDFLKSYTYGLGKDDLVKYGADQ